MDLECGYSLPDFSAMDELVEAREENRLLQRANKLHMQEIQTLRRTLDDIITLAKGV